MATLSTEGMITKRTSVGKTGIGQLMEMLESRQRDMTDKDATVEKIIASAQTSSSSLSDAKRKALKNESYLLNSIFNDIDAMNTFLKNIILIENLFNKTYQKYKPQQEETRKQYAKNIAEYENKGKIQNKAQSFVELVFGGQTHVSSLQEWLNKVIKVCNAQNIKIKSNTGSKVKQIERTFYKAFYVYDCNNDGYKNITDLLRCSLVFDSFVDLYKCFTVIETLAEQTLGGILRVKDRFHPQQIPFGYRDLMINILCPSSKEIVCEIQLQFAPFYKYKKVSHRMYKTARLFQIDEENLAYNYAGQYLRPKLGSFKVYELTKDDVDSGTATDEKKEEAKKASDMKFDELLTDWGLSQYIARMEAEGWEDANDWGDLTEEDLKNDMGFKKGHINKFKKKYKEWLALKTKEEEDGSMDDDNDNNVNPAKELTENESKKEDSEQLFNVTTPNDYNYKQWFDVNNNFVKFRVKATNDVHIALGEEKEHDADHWEIVFGGWSNSKSAIRKQNQGANISEYHGAILNRNKLVSLWISWDDDKKEGYLRVGRGDIVGQNEVMKCKYDADVVSNIKLMSCCSGWGSTADFEIDLRDPKGIFSLNTPNDYNYKDWFDVNNNNFIKFKVKGRNDVHVALGKEKEHDADHWEIVFGGWNNSKSVIRNRNQGTSLAEYHGSVLKRNAMVSFWISWDYKDALIVGRGAILGKNILMQCKYDKDVVSNIEYMSGCSGWGANAVWKIDTRDPVGVYSVHTENDYNYKQWYDINNKYVKLRVQARNDAHIALGADKDHDADHWEIVLGGWNNSKSVIRKRNQGAAVATFNGSILKRNNMINIWIAWKAGKLSVGKGHKMDANTVIMECEYDTSVVKQVKCVSVSTGWEATGDWKIDLRK